MLWLLGVCMRDACCLPAWLCVHPIFLASMFNKPRKKRIASQTYLRTKVLGVSVRRGFASTFRIQCRMQCARNWRCESGRWHALNHQCVFSQLFSCCRTKIWNFPITKTLRLCHAPTNCIIDYYQRFREMHIHWSWQNSLRKLESNFQLCMLRCNGAAAPDVTEFFTRSVRPRSVGGEVFAATKQRKKKGNPNSVRRSNWKFELAVWKHGECTTFADDSVKHAVLCNRKPQRATEIQFRHKVAIVPLQIHVRSTNIFGHRIDRGTVLRVSVASILISSHLLISHKCLLQYIFIFNGIRDQFDSLLFVFMDHEMMCFLTVAIRIYVRLFACVCDERKGISS